MEKIIILQGVTPEFLLKEIDALIEKRLTEALQKLAPPKNIRYLSRKEVCEQLKISLTTLHYWAKYGIVKRHKIGNRVLYKSNEIEDALTGEKLRFRKKR